MPVKNAQAYYDSLGKRGVERVLKLYDKGGHGFGLADGVGGAPRDATLATWPGLAAAWMETQGWFKPASTGMSGRGRPSPPPAPPRRSAPEAPGGFGFRAEAGDGASSTRPGAHVDDSAARPAALILSFGKMQKVFAASRYATELEFMYRVILRGGQATAGRPPGGHRGLLQGRQLHRHPDRSSGGGLPGRRDREPFPGDAILNEETWHLNPVIRALA